MRLEFSRKLNGRTEYEEESVQRRADHWHPEAARGGREDGGSVPGARDQRGDVLRVEVEVRRDGCERSGAAATDGRREPAAEAAGGGSEPGQGDAQGGDSKKRMELAGLREYVAHVSVEFRLERAQGLQAAGRGTVELPL